MHVHGTQQQQQQQCGLGYKGMLVTCATDPQGGAALRPGTLVYVCNLIITQVTACTHLIPLTACTHLIPLAACTHLIPLAACTRVHVPGTEW